MATISVGLFSTDNINVEVC